MNKPGSSYQNSQSDHIDELKLLDRKDPKFFDKLFDIKNKEFTKGLFEELGISWTEDCKLDISKINFQKDIKLKWYNNLIGLTFYTHIYRLLKNKESIKSIQKGNVISKDGAMSVICQYCQERNIDIIGNSLTIDQIFDIQNKDKTKGLFEELGIERTLDNKLDISKINFAERYKLNRYNDYSQSALYTNIYKLLGDTKTIKTNKLNRVDMKSSAISTMTQYCQENNIEIILPQEALSIDQIFDIQNKEKTRLLFEELGINWSEDHKLDIGNFKFSEKYKLNRYNNFLQSTFYNNIYKLLKNKDILSTDSKGKIISKNLALITITQYCQENNIEIILPQEALSVDQIFDIQNKEKTKGLFAELGIERSKDSKLDIINLKFTITNKLESGATIGNFYTNIYKLLVHKNSIKINEQGKILNKSSAISTMTQYCKENNIEVMLPQGILSIHQIFDIQNKEKTKGLFAELGIKRSEDSKLDISEITFSQSIKLENYTGINQMTLYNNIYELLKYKSLIKIGKKGNRIGNRPSAISMMTQYCQENNIEVILSQDVLSIDQIFDTQNKEKTKGLFDELGIKRSKDGKLDISEIRFSQSLKLKNYNDIYQFMLYINIYKLLINKNLIKVNRQGKITNKSSAIFTMAQYCQENNIEIILPQETLSIDQIFDIQNKDKTKGLFAELGVERALDNKLDIGNFKFSEKYKLNGYNNFIKSTFYNNIYKLLKNKDIISADLKGQITSKNLALITIKQYCQENNIEIILSENILSIHQIFDIQNKDKTKLLFEELGVERALDNKLDISKIIFQKETKLKGYNNLTWLTFYTNMYSLLKNKDKVKVSTHGKISSNNLALITIKQYCQENNIDIILPQEILSIDQIFDIKNKEQTKEIFDALGRERNKNKKLDVSNIIFKKEYRIMHLNNITQFTFYNNMYNGLTNKKGIQVDQKLRIRGEKGAIDVISKYCETRKNKIDIIFKENIMSMHDLFNIRNKEQTKDIFVELGLQWSYDKKLDISNLKFNDKKKIKGLNNIIQSTFYSNLYRLLSPLEQEGIYIDTGGKISSTKSAIDVIKKYCNQNNIPYIYHEVDKSQNISDIPNISEYMSMAKIVGRKPMIEIMMTQYKGFAGMGFDQVEKMLSGYLGDSQSYTGDKIGFSGISSEFFGIILGNDDISTSIIKSIKDDFVRHIIDYKKNNNYANPDLPKIYAERRFDFVSKTQKLQPFITGLVDKSDDFWDKVFNHPNINSLKKYLGKDQSRGFPGREQWINILSFEQEKRLLVADDMGLGKTGSAIGSVEYLKSQNKIKNALIVCPANMIKTWTDRLDIGKDGYFADTYKPRVLVLDDKSKFDYSFDEYDYILMSSARLNDNNVSKVLDKNYDMLIVDEAHELKNTTSGIWSQNLIKLSDKINSKGYMLALTGTPIPNTIRDIAIMVRLLYPHKFDNIDDRNLIRNITKGADKLHLGISYRNKTNRKLLTDWIYMPAKNKYQHIIKPTEMETNLSKVITQDINLSYTQKLILLRKLYMCPTSINPEVGPSQKMIEVVDLIQEKIIKNGNKRIYIILNDYIEDMIRNNQITQEDGDEILKSEGYIIDYVRFRLEEYSDLYPFDITSYHGNINNTQRSNMQNKFNDKESKGIQILFVSGNAAKVGIDLSGADTIIVYNEPYTVSDLNQEISRAYRVGLDHEIDIHTFITDNTIEIGIHTYINQKHKAIEKLIENKDLMTDMEINLILSEDINDLKYHPDTNFAQYYANEKSILYDMFSTNKGVGEDKFLENMSKVSMDGITNFEKYAEVYNMLGRRNYQSNANRINSQIISIISQKNEIKNPTIIDIGSGSQLLAKTINEDKQENIISIDINPNYMDNPFSKTILNDKNTYKYRQAIGSMMRGSMTDTYISDEYSDFVNISLAYHYTSINFKKNKIDRITSLIETNRILKPGGYAIINEIYSLNFAEKQKLQDALGLLGFEIMDQFTGNARSTDKNNFSSNILTIRKAGPSKKLSDLLDKKYQKSLEEGLSFDYNKDNISGQSFIIDKFEIGNNQYSINLNKSDKNLQNEESKTSSIIEGMKDQFGTIDSIPEKTLNNNGFFSYRYNQKKSLKKTRKIARKLSDGSFIFVV